MRASFLLACNVLVATTSLVGCMDPAEDELAAEEDAAADAADGKTDGAAFQRGPFTREPDYETPKEPLIAFFHAPDGSEARGESGLFDLVTYEEGASDLGTRYETGTYKLYRYQGRDRIRLTNGDGRVVLRSDWSYAAGTLKLGEDLEMWQPRQRPEELVDCLVVDVLDTGVFEESLSPYEYPSVSVDKEGNTTSLQIGGSSYDSTEATVTIDESAEAFTATAVTEYETISIRVPNKAPRRGKIVQRAEGEDENVVAQIVCR